MELKASVCNSNILKRNGGHELDKIKKIYSNWHYLVGDNEVY
jgi:hypothetical protein